MTPRQQRQLRILAAVDSGEMTMSAGAASMERSPRQMRRLLASFRAEGIEGVIHGNSGRHPTNKMSPSIREQIVNLARSKYAGFNHTQLTEMLVEKEGLFVSRSTVRTVCREENLGPPHPHRRPSVHRSRRQCRAREGEMLQLDGSPHEWLEKRGPRLTLVSGIDDATNTLWGIFREGETSEAYMSLMKSIVGERGIPETIYTDRTVIVAGTSRRYKPLTDDPPTGMHSQFAHACTDLGIGIILAHSPQAKGRIERSHGTLQDRLVSVLRLERISTLDGAQQVLTQYLADHNTRFTHPATIPKTAWRPCNDTNALDDVFCPREQRTVALDNTVHIFGHIIDIPKSSSGTSYVHRRVWVHRRYDGAMSVFYQGSKIAQTPS